MRGAVDAVARESGLAVVALGRFGGGELSYPSDLDLVFVAAGDRDDIAEAERAGVRLLRFLGGGTPPGSTTSTRISGPRAATGRSCAASTAWSTLREPAGPSRGSGWRG